VDVDNNLSKGVAVAVDADEMELIDFFFILPLIAITIECVCDVDFACVVK
jgi:hypothetical protein